MDHMQTVKEGTLFFFHAITIVTVVSKFSIITLHACIIIIIPIVIYGSACSES